VAWEAVRSFNCVVEKLSKVVGARPLGCTAVTRPSCVVPNACNSVELSAVISVAGRAPIWVLVKVSACAVVKLPIVVAVRPAACAVDSPGTFSASSDVVDSAFNCAGVSPCDWVEVRAANSVVE